MPDLTQDSSAQLRALISNIARRDRAAFTALYDATAAQLFGVALRILHRRDLAEEALQESYVAIWERAGNYSPVRGAPMTWLVTIVRHRAIDQLRRSGSRAEDRSVSEETLLGVAAGAGYGADRGAELDALQRCLDEIEAQPRRAVLLAYAYGLTHQELAARLGAPVGTVKSWIRRSLERLKRCLDG
ncbi:MAG: sigma-70 family RNA polymerase sigma factor [Stellaceae bacterium]